MQILQHYRAFDRATGSLALTIGNFDGVHLGHRALIGRVRACADAESLTPALLTFVPHPARVLGVREPPPLLVTPPDKRRLLADAGVDLLVEQPFDLALAALTPEAFVKDVLLDGLSAAHLVVGYDFVFGARRAGNLQVLQALGAKWGFGVSVVGALTAANGETASSSRIRDHVRRGAMPDAAALLGRPYHLHGTVVRGAGRGHGLGIPTANLSGGNELVPPPGVYTGWLDWGESPRPAAVSVGTNPTFGDSGLSVEAHVLPEFAPAGLDLYGRECHLLFDARLRDQVKYSGPAAVAALLEQIAADLAQARDRLARIPVPRSLLGIPAT